MRKGLLWIFLGATAAFGIHGPSAAPHATSDLGKKLSNPSASLIQVPFQHNHNEGLANGNGPRDFIKVLPVVPFSRLSC